jgi:gas vesicle protein
MAMNNNNNNKNIPKNATVAFVIGALAGGVAALLLAPESGPQLRKRLKSGAQDLKERARHKTDTVREKAEIVTGAMKGAAIEAKNTYRDELDKRRQPDTEQLARRTGA